MSIVRWLISSGICILAFNWALRLHAYFYGLVTADKISLLFSMVVSFVLLKKVADIIQKWSVTVFVILISLPFLLYLLINQLVLFTPHSWLIIHLFLALTALGVRTLFESKFLFLTPLVFAGVFLFPFEFQKAQLKFYDKLESSIETRFGEAQIVQWKGDYWMYYNGQLQFSTIDGHMFREAYIQPLMQFGDEEVDVLLVGGDNGLLESELSKFKVSLTILPLDPEFHSFARSSNAIAFKRVNDKVVEERVNIFDFLSNHVDQYDIVIIDTPDPLNLNYQQYYTAEFYELVFGSLQDEGLMVTHSGDFYKNGTQVRQIWNSVEYVGFHVLPYQCQIPTIGHWSWVIGAKNLKAEEMMMVLSGISDTESIWWNQEAADLMFAFGKDYFSKGTTGVNTLNQPAP